MLIGKVDGIMHTCGTCHADAIGDRDFKRQGSKRSKRHLFHLVRMYQKDGLFWFHLKGRYHKSTPAIQFCTREQLRWCSFLLDDQRHLVRIRLTKDGYS